MLTGITEPLEFTFLFAAPALYAVHCVLAGAAYMLMHLLNVGVGLTFSGGLIDLTLFGVMQGNAKTSWLWIPAVGAVYFVVYYLVFTVMIRRFDYRTPGRDSASEVRLYTRKDMPARRETAAQSENADAAALSRTIVEGLGGRENIADIDCCITRLRCTVRDGSKVDETLLKSTGAAGVLHQGTAVQIVYGPKVTSIKSDLEQYLKG